jgi:hypothetical protein
MPQFVLMLLLLALVLLVVGIVWFNLWIESFRRGGLTHWRVRSARRVYFGGSLYRSRAMLPRLSDKRARLPRQRRVQITMTPAQRALFLNGMDE